MHSSARVEWKDQALEDLQTIDTAASIPNFNDLHEGWFSQQGIVMADGSWIAYRSKCHKEDPNINDIFIGRASDGKWYYSTYHFCIGACVILMDDRPESLASFVKEHALVEFDGKSDDCLRSTWNP